MHTRSSYICIHGSLFGISFFLTCFIGRNNLLHVNSNPWILQEVYLEQAVFIVFSLLLEESLNLVMLSFISLFHIFYTLFFIITSISSTRLFLSGFLVILGIIAGCSCFSFFLGIFMFFLMCHFSSWVHGVFYMP
jgi:hypothetical protein